MASHTHTAAPPPIAVSRVTIRYLSLAALAVGLAALHIRRPATFCLLRATTGIPCPFCGGTTAAVRLGHADVRGALAASPLALGLLVALPWVGTRQPAQWWTASRRNRWLVIGGVLAMSEVWELFRFGVVSWH